jgi:hypothetical protein
MYRLSLFVSLIILSFSVSAQNKTYLGIEGAITHDIFTIDPNINDFTVAFLGNSDNISQASLQEESLGFTLSRELHKNFTIETGLISKKYVMGYRYAKGSYTGGDYWNAFRARQIPLRLISNINIVKNKFDFITQIGYHFCVNRDFHKNRILINQDDFASDYYSSAIYQPGLRNIFSLLEAGCGIQLKLCKIYWISFSASFFTGFKNMTEIDITYKDESNKLHNGSAISKGDYWNVACSLRYPISNFWKK